MKKIIILGIILTLLFLVGCTPQIATPEKVEVSSLIKEETNVTGSLPKVETEEPLICTDECSQPTCEGLYYIACSIGDNGCKYKQSKEKIKGGCGVECLENSDCPSHETCSSNKCEEKPDILKALEETKEVLEDYQEKTDKLDECTRLCAGDDYNIPYIKNEWYNVCYQLYYYTGIEGLDEQIVDCKK